jgi:uncharacterized membrane protein YccC
VEGWSKIVAGVVLGVAGTVYATNEEVRKRLPRSARDIPDNVRQRFENAVSAAREASTRRREEILRDLAEHEAQQDRLARQAREEATVRHAEEEAPQTTQRTEEGSA